MVTHDFGTLWYGKSLTAWIWTGLFKKIFLCENCKYKKLQAE